MTVSARAETIRLFRRFFLNFPEWTERRLSSTVATMTKDLHCGSAEWRPLETILPLEKCGAFMYMGWLEVDGQRLHHYKHGVTRRYLFVTDELKTYQYIGGYDYVPQGKKRAIQHVLDSLSELRPRPTGRSR